MRGFLDAQQDHSKYVQLPTDSVSHFLGGNDPIYDQILRNGPIHYQTLRKNSNKKLKMKIEIATKSQKYYTVCQHKTEYS